MTRASDGQRQFLRLLKINVELMAVCDWLNEQRNIKTASRLIPITDDLTHLVAEMSVEKRRKEMI